MSNGQDLTVRSENKMVTDQTWNTLYKQAAEIIKSGFLPPSIKTPAQAIAVILTGRELGIGMMEAFRGIHIIDNRPSISPQLMLSLIYNSGVAENIAIKSTPTACTISGNRKGQPNITTQFTEEDAKNMGLLFRDNWKKQKQNMLRWRAISAWARLVCPDVIGGLYTPEELESSDDIIGKQESALELSEKIHTDPKEAEKFYEETATKILDDLAKCQDANDVWVVEREYKQAIGLFTDEERAYITEMIDNRRNELITEDTLPEGEKSQETAPNAQKQAVKPTPEEVLEAQEAHSQAFGREYIDKINACTTKAQLNLLKASAQFITGRMKCNVVMKDYLDAVLKARYTKLEGK